MNYDHVGSSLIFILCCISKFYNYIPVKAGLTLLCHLLSCFSVVVMHSCLNQLLDLGYFPIHLI